MGMGEKKQWFEKIGIFVKFNAMSKPKSNFNNQVSLFLDELNHPFRSEINYLRNCILLAQPELNENIKWNSPNYSIGEEDRVTMRVQPLKKQVQLVFHRGAKKQVQPESKLISTNSKLLVWKENDRAVVTFKSMGEIENSKDELTEIIKDWTKASI